MEDPGEINYSTLSYTLTKQINKKDKKANGIYFTSPKIIIKNLIFLEPYMKNIEPSCGSCEDLLMLHKRFNNLKITGIEFNKTIFESIKSFENNSIKLYNEDYLTFKNPIKYDLIIGNPPYYVMKKKNVDSSYYSYFDGRPNIFILFIIKSLQLLNDNGILSFVLPKNFLNCLYYNKTRKYISNNFEILKILECGDDYIETKQKTIIIILRKTVENNFINNEFILNNGKYTIFGLPKNIIKLKSLYNDSTTLQILDFKVNVGNVVWNQCKTDLTTDKSKTLLIYSSDIKCKKLIIQSYSNKDKKNYINKTGITGPLLVINRGYGMGKYKFNYCLIEGKSDYLVENHLICIKYTKIISNEKLHILYRKIMKSFECKKTQEFINLYFGNNAINTTELREILPIYLYPKT